MPADLILYAVIAAALVIWLRNTLGTRHGEERQRDNPLADLLRRSDDPDQRGKIVDITDQVTLVPETASSAFQGLDLADQAVAEGLGEILRADRSFDPQRFVDSAKEAFPVIVECFADGDADTLQSLLAPPVYKAFTDAIDERKARGETVETEIHAVRQVQLLEARLVERLAFLKIKFVAQETCVVKDREGRIISGNPDRVSEMTDIWTFGRDTRSKDPTWLLYETADDPAEDHQATLPNTKA